jgi:hypothetical protein
VEEVVRRRAPEFGSHGFELTEIKLAGSPKLQVFPMFRFLNKRARMAIDISFLPTSQGHQGGFGVLLVNPANHKLSVKEYLKFHGREELAQAFNYRDPCPDIRGFANSFLSVLLDLMSTDLKPILEGKVWEETPIDWMGYK